MKNTARTNNRILKTKEQNSSSGLLALFLLRLRAKA